MLSLLKMYSIIHAVPSENISYTVPSENIFHAEILTGLLGQFDRLQKSWVNAGASFWAKTPKFEAISTYIHSSSSYIQYILFNLPSSADFFVKIRARINPIESGPCTKCAEISFRPSKEVCSNLLGVTLKQTSLTNDNIGGSDRRFWKSCPWFGIKDSIYWN